MIDWALYKYFYYYIIIYYYKWPATGIVWPASKRVRPTMTESWLGARTQRTATFVGGGGGGGVRVHECGRACMHACVRDVFAIYDNDMLALYVVTVAVLAVAPCSCALKCVFPVAASHGAASCRAIAVNHFE